MTSAFLLTKEKLTHSFFVFILIYNMISSLLPNFYIAKHKFVGYQLCNIFL